MLAITLFLSLRGKAVANLAPPTTQGQIRVVRKTIKSLSAPELESGPVPKSDSDSESESGSTAPLPKSQEYSNEDRILTLLQSLRHDNIIRLLASYTIKDPAPTHNFLFPVADHTLSKLLATALDPSEGPWGSPSKGVWGLHFPSDYSLFQQLYGLASAIDSLHNYVLYGEDTVTMEMIGCHYDLNPRNILVDKGKLLLADFGLSRLKEDTSKSMFKAGAGDYMAPECEPLHDGSFNKGIISRPSDIWSLGCVIVDVLIYHVGGRKAGQDFAKSRKTPVPTPWGSFISDKFHSRNAVSPAVSQWLHDRTTSPGINGFKEMLERVLVMDPMARLRAPEVTSALFFQAQRVMFSKLSDTFTNLHESQPSACPFEFTVERERFQIWGCGSSLRHYHGDCSELPVSPRDWLERSPKCFKAVVETLLALERELQVLAEILESKAHQTWPVYKRVQSLVDDLWATQRAGETELNRYPLLTETMRVRVEGRILSRNDGLRELMGNTWQHPDSNKDYRNIIRLSALKFMTDQLGTDENKVGKAAGRLLRGRIESQNNDQEFHRFGMYPERNHDKPVLVEYTSYHSGQDESEWAAIQRRADNLAILLGGGLPGGGRADMLDGFRILRCIGYFHEPRYTSFGMMYAFPEDDTNTSNPLTSKDVLTLADVIRGFARPDLEAVFRLALELVRCIAAFHKAGWLHKNVSTYNILFFNRDLAIALSQRPRSHGHNKDTPDRGRSRGPTATLAPSPETGTTPLQAGNRQGKTPEAPSEKSGIRESFRKIFPRSTSRRPGSLKPPSTSSRLASAASSISQVPLEPPKTIPTISNTTTQDSTTEVPDDALKRMYLVGLNHTRENENWALTTEESLNPAQRLYQHPSYLRRQPTHRFCPQYDWFSVGVVLLELGLWQGAEHLYPGDIKRSRGDDADVLRVQDWLLNDVPKLSPIMGKSYQAVVRTCLGYVRDKGTECEVPSGHETIMYADEIVRQLEQSFRFY